VFSRPGAGELVANPDCRVPPGWWSRGRRRQTLFLWYRRGPSLSDPALTPWAARRLLHRGRPPPRTKSIAVVLCMGRRSRRQGFGRRQITNI